MNKNLLFIGTLFLGASLIASSLIMSKSIDGNKQLIGNLNGLFTLDDSYDNNANKDILMVYDAAAMFGYQEENFIRDIENDRLEGLPFTQIGGRYIFSRKSLEEWLYNRTLMKSSIND